MPAIAVVVIVIGSSLFFYKDDDDGWWHVRDWQSQVYYIYLLYRQRPATQFMFMQKDSERFNSLCITWWFSDIYANWTIEIAIFLFSLILLLFYRWKVYTTQCKLYICTHLDKTKLFYYYRLPIIYGWSFVFPHSNVSFKHFVIFLLLLFFYLWWSGFCTVINILFFPIILNVTLIWF